MLVQWADNVIEGQQRLMVNSFVPLGQKEVLEIYEALYEQGGLKQE